MRGRDPKESRDRGVVKSGARSCRRVGVAEAQEADEGQEVWAATHWHWALNIVFRRFHLKVLSLSGARIKSLAYNQESGINGFENKVER